MGLEKLVKAIKKYNKFLLTTHTNMEGDALGSALGMYRLLKKLGKSAFIICDDELPYGYDFMPDIEQIRKLHYPLPKAERGKVKFDAMVILDCSDLSRCGQVWRLNSLKKPVLNIDHHISNTRFADINWVEPYVSSCSEMIYALYKKMGVAFDQDAAMLLYVGILTDTGGFRYPNTTPLAHRAAAELVAYGLDVAQIHKQIYGQIPFEDIKLLIKILPQVMRVHSGKTIWFEIRRDVLKNKKISFDLSENILSFARSIKGVEVAVLFKENLSVKNEIRINLRSQGKVDVNRIAQAFGGGGHKTASGATVRGKLESVRKKVLAKIKESLV